MDIVDINHLIPSDQLDDSMLIGQNLECEASNEFGAGLQLEDSLKNMLSDKDPMFGSASSQFNPLDNEDASFLIADSTIAGLDDGATPGGLKGAGAGLQREPAKVKRPVGRPRKVIHSLENEQSDGQPSTTTTNPKPRGRHRKLANSQPMSFLIEKGIGGTQLKKDLCLGGRINVQDFNGGLWLNPVVELKRLTVTVGGFRIELLPGPSYSESTDGAQPVCVEDGDIEYTTLQDDNVSVHTATPEKGVGPTEKCTAEEVPLGLGPYVNPNDVQASNGMLRGSTCFPETKHDNRQLEKPKQAQGKEDKHAQHIEQNNKTGQSKEKQKMLSRSPIKPKHTENPLKSRSLTLSRLGSMIKGPNAAQHTPSKTTNKAITHGMKWTKEKKGVAPLKRQGEASLNEHPSKVQRTMSGGPTPPKPTAPGPAGVGVKRSQSSDSRLGEQKGQIHPKSESVAVITAAPGQSLKTPEGVQEKPKVRKPDKILQKQKSKSVRAISLDEPQLFVPDNAPPALKKEPAEEEQPASSDAVWDGSTHCGLCKKHHNNTFMVGCGRCDDWFHGDCVGLDLVKVREMEDEDQMYVCLKCCGEESTKVEAAEAQPGAAKAEVQDKLSPKPRQGPPPQPQALGGRKDSDKRPSTELVPKTGLQLKHETKSKYSPSSVKKPVSVEEIRRSVRDSLKEILVQRLKESDLKVPSDKASEVARKTERELFHLYKDTDSKYKNKYRSLMFNLKDTKNNVLFKRVLKGEISPANLIRMSPEELASKELAAWRQRENRHTIEMIEKEQREVERRPITKITHKGEIEIESEEPVKAPEPVEPEPAPKVPEDPAEVLPLEQKPKTDLDTTSQHKSHLFDLHCKICTGRMAPPVEEAGTKVVKVATTVVRRQSTTVEDAKSTAAPVKDEDLHLTVLEESLRNATSLTYEGRCEYRSGREDETSFLSSLKFLWRGFVNMPAVAKLVTKAFPVSGALDSLTEDLPDSVQVGGRISPQIVWDYFDKIRATGTKEVCLIRFSPETEEDEISYALLFAYFSSRKRFGVVSNNLKKVKDMYLIPLAATEKVPHQLVPFDGPGLENNRPNLLLGLVIRQRPKKDFNPVAIVETAKMVPESKPLTVSTNEARAVEKEEKLYLSSLTPAKTKDTVTVLPATDAEEPAEELEAFEETSAAEDGNNQESYRPLRFLPGVLVGWGGELPPLPDVGGKPTPIEAEGAKKIQAPHKMAAVTSGNSAKSCTAASRLDRFVIKKREPKPVKAEAGLSSPTPTSAAKQPAVKEAVKEVAPQRASLSLKDKPPDVSTEMFLASLSTQSQTQASAAVSANKHVGISSEKEFLGRNSPLLSKPQATSDPTNHSKPPLSGILKKASAYSSASEDNKHNEKATKGKATSHPPVDHKPIPALSSTSNEPLSVCHPGAKAPEPVPEEEMASNISASCGEKDNDSVSQADATATQMVNFPGFEGPQAASRAAAPSEAAESQCQTEAVLMASVTASVPPQQQAPQVPGSHGYGSGTPPNELPDTARVPGEEDNGIPWLQESSTESHTIPWLQEGSTESYTIPGLQEGSTESHTIPGLQEGSTESHTILWLQEGSTESHTIPGLQEGSTDSHTTPGRAIPWLQEGSTESHTIPWLQEGSTDSHTTPGRAIPWLQEGSTDSHTTPGRAIPWLQEGSTDSHTPPGLSSEGPDSYSESSDRVPNTRDDRRAEEQYSDPWDRPRHSEDREHHARHSHQKKSRHHERGRRRERSHDDKHRDRSRHHGHSEDRHSDRRKDRHHSADHSSRHHRERHRHRKDSDYENGRRGSKDSYS